MSSRTDTPPKGIDRERVEEFVANLEDIRLVAVGVADDIHDLVERIRLRLAEVRAGE